ILVAYAIDLRRAEVDIVDFAAHRATAASGQPLQKQVSLDLDVNDQGTSFPLGLQHLIHELRLREGARKTVQDKPSLAVGLADPLLHNAADNLVWNQLPRFHFGLGGESQGSLISHCFPQHVASRNLRNRKVLGDFVRLSPLSCPGSTEEY